MGWTQPVCENRFKEMYPGREPTRIIVDDGDCDLCCFCLTPTKIYVRIDPKTVPYPQKL